MNETNGTSTKHALEGWTVIVWGARTMIGRGQDGGIYARRRFTTIYDLVVEKIPVQGPNGQMGVQEAHRVNPVCMLAGITSLDISEEVASFIDATTLSRQEQVGLRQLISQTEEAIAQSKRKMAGIEMAEKMKETKSFGGGARGDG
jgi:hypothetical protein